MNKIEQLIAIGGKVTTPREFFLRTVSIERDDTALRNYAVAVSTIIATMSMPHLGTRVIWLHSDDVDSAVSLSDVVKEVPAFPTVTVNFSEEVNYNEEVQFSPAEITLEGWANGLPCLYVQPVADGGPPSDYFIFFLPGSEV